jgi:hypothetical protein
MQSSAADAMWIFQFLLPASGCLGDQSGAELGTTDVATLAKSLLEASDWRVS